MSFLGIKSGRKRGWSYMGRVLLERLPPELQERLRKIGDAVTVNEGDRYIRFENRGLVTATLKRPIIDFYRRFKPPRSWNKGEIIER
jgi:hypothetical protein